MFMKPKSYCDDNIKYLANCIYPEDLIQKRTCSLGTMYFLDLKIKLAFS